MSDYDEWPSPRDYSEIRSDRIKYLVQDFFADDESEQYKYPQFKDALWQYSDEIAAYAREAGISTEVPSRYGASPFEELVNDCTDIFYDIGYAVSYPDMPQKRLNCWKHFDRPLELIGRKMTPKISRDEAEAAVGKYLKSPCRAQSLDRLLIDLMIAMELFAFGDEVINPLHLPGFTATPLHKVKPIKDWLLWRVAMATVCGGTFGIFCGLSAINFFPAAWLVWPFIVALLVFVVDFIWTTILLPSVWIKVSKQKHKISDLLAALNAVYSSVVSSGPISARHVLREVEAAADKGVGWPAPLFALLDDVMARDATF